MHKQEVAYSIVNILMILVLILIIVLLAVKFIHPQKYLDQTRDAQRLSDVTSLATALDLYIADGQSLSQLKLNQTYSSLMGSSNLGGTGWLPLNFSLVSSGVPIKSVPLDPLNNQGFYYRVGINSQNQTYEIDCRFENAKNIVKAKNDGGNNSDWYEVGTDLTILK